MWIGGEVILTPFYPIVDDYFNKKMLARLGYSFDGSQLSDFEVEAYHVISSEAAKLERADLQREAKMRGKNGQ
jgi:hypothetical protein